MYKKQNPDEKGYVGVRSKKGVDHMLVLKVPARHSLTRCNSYSEVTIKVIRVFTYDRQV